MAAPVVASQQTAVSSGSGSSLVVTAPTGITTGDLLVGYYISFNTSSALTHSTPAGWTRTLALDGGTDGEMSVFTKVAVLADESAVNYTFTSTGATPEFSAAGVLRISGVAPGSEIKASQGIYTNVSGSSFSETVAVDSIATDSLILLGFGTVSLNIPEILTMSGYATTPALTFTEVFDVGTRNGVSDGNSLAVASASVSAITSFTNIAATYSQTADRARYGTILIINAPNSPTVDVGNIVTTPSLYSVTASQVNIGVDMGLVEVEPEVRGVSARATAPQQWTNEAKPTSTWTKEQKL